MSRSTSSLLAIAGLLALGALLLAQLGPDAPPAGDRADERPQPAHEATRLQASADTAAEPAAAAPARRTVEAAARAAAAQPDGLLRGRVLDPDGRPEPRVQVAALALQADGTPGQRPAHDAAITDELGRFALQPPAAARIALVARQPGRRPACTVLALTADALAQEQVLQLEQGFAIAGRVVQNGAPVSRAHVGLDLRFGTPGVFGFGSEAFWIDGRLEEKHARAETDADGRFRLTGLGPHEHRLEFGPPPGVRHVVAGLERQVHAPAEELVLELGLAEIEVVVHRLGAPLAGAKVTAGAGERSVDAHSTGEPVVFAVPPHEPVQLTAEHGESRREEQTLTAPARGQRTVAHFDLQPVERPDLLLHLPGAAGAAIERIQVVLRPRRGFGDTEFTADRVADQDTFAVTPVPLDPGDYDVAVAPTLGSGGSLFLLPAVARVTLPARGTVQVRLTLALGGRVGLDVHSPHAGELRARYRVLDMNGNERDGGLLVLGGNELSSIIGSAPFDVVLGSIRFSGKPRRLNPTELAHRYSVLVPGRYRLEVDGDGHRPWRGEVVVRAGKTTSQRVDLVPE